MISVGFSGTRRGLTFPQTQAVLAIMHGLEPDEAHYGDCSGGDEEFFLICNDSALSWAKRGVVTIGHPSDLEDQRAHTMPDVMLQPLPPLERNQNIVDKTTHMIIAPWNFQEQLRSGTWATKRYSDKAKRETFIVYPNGGVAHIIWEI